MHVINCGIDYSMSCPAICVDGKYFLFVHSNKKFCGDFQADNIALHGFEYDHKKNGHDSIQRFSTLASILISTLTTDTPGIAFLEGYAYGARGKVFEIGENTGILKYMLRREGWHLNIIPPTEVKKFATGKGNANKEKMADAWLEEFGYELHDVLGCKRGASPAADCIDAYFIWKTGQKTQ